MKYTVDSMMSSGWNRELFSEESGEDSLDFLKFMLTLKVTSSWV